MKLIRAARRLAAALLVALAPAAHPVEPSKVLRYIIPAAETGFDPATTRDLYANHVVQAVFETLYTYDYLARPVALRPLGRQQVIMRSLTMRMPLAQPSVRGYKKHPILLQEWTFIDIDRAQAVHP